MNIFNIRRVWNFSYYMANDYPQIPLLEDWSLKVIKKCEINREMIEQTISILKNEGDYENCLLMLLISRYYLYPSTLILIRFEDFGTNKDGQRFLKIFIKARAMYEVINVDDETFEVVCELKRSRVSLKKQQYETKRSWTKGFKVKGRFIFPVQRCSIGRRLHNGFNGKIPKFSSTPLKIISMCKREDIEKNQIRI